MTSSLDEMYDEMLRGEFSSRGKHAAPDTGPALVEEPRPAGRHGLHAAPEAPLHAEFEIHEVQVREVQVRDETPPPAAAEGTSAESEGPRGLARYRNAAMVGAGGLACAAVGAFLGGLGGAFTISPAAAHPLASSTAEDPLTAAAAAGEAQDMAGSTDGTAAVTTAVLSSLSGSLTQAAAPLQWLTSADGSMPAPVADLADVTTTSGSGGDAGAGSGSGAGSGCTPTTTDLGLGCVLGSLTTALGNVGTLPSDPTEELGSLAPGLTGVVSDVTGTLADLGSLLPIASLPLPAGGLPSLGLPGLSALDASLPTSLGTPTSLLSGTGAITSLLEGVTAAATGGTSGSTGSTVPTLPSLPGSGGKSSGAPGLPGVSRACRSRRRPEARRPLLRGAAREAARAIPRPAAAPRRRPAPRRPRPR